MLETNYYAMTGLVSAFVCATILVCNNLTFERGDTKRRYFSALLVLFTITTCLDTVWGFMSTKTLNLGNKAFAFVSFLILLLILFSVTFWCIFLTSYFDFKEPVLFRVLQCIPLVLAVALLFTQTFGNTIFRIDENGVYKSGPYRSWLFVVQFFYFILAFIKIVFFLTKHRTEHGRLYKFALIVCSIIPVVFALLQHKAPAFPYYPLSMMVSSVCIFNGMMVIVKIRNSERYETISKETYMGFEALSQSFVAVILIDLEKDKDIPVKTTSYANGLLEPNMPTREKILRIFTKTADPEYIDELKEFSDIDTLPARMADRKSISLQYRSSGIGWCVATFTAAERDGLHYLKKAVLSVQSVDEEKKKEIEYEEALSRAYKNENAVLAELIKMQSTAVVASDGRRIIIVNDAALKLFDREGVDPIGMEIFEFWKDAPIKTPDEIKERFYEVEENGGSFSYQTVSYVEGNEKDMKYLMADVKRVDLLDGSKVMITCFYDITAGKLLEDKLRTLSETDPLTNIANRRCGESQIKLLMSEGIGGMFCLFDINGFKTINDSFGHQTGDDVLVAVANAIRSSFRSDDIIMRLGGDEFAIYMRNVLTPELARIRIARLFENVARIELPNIPKGSITVSLGAVGVNADKDADIDSNYDEVYKRADEQMYRCKGKPGSNLSIEIRKEMTEEGNEERTEDEES